MALRKVFCLFLLLAAAAPARALEGVMAHTLFYQPSGTGDTLRPVLEIFWEINPRSLHFFRSPDSLLSARIRAEVVVRSADDGAVVLREFWTTVTPGRRYEAAASSPVRDLYRAQLQPGRYAVQVLLDEPDFDSLQTVLADTVQVDAAPRGAPTLSEPQLLDTFYVGTTVGGTSHRAGYDLVPHANDFIDDGHNLLHFYTEAYGLESIEASRYPLRLRTYITRRTTDPPSSSFQRVDTIRSAGARAFRPRTLRIPALTSGNWFLATVLEDKTGRVLAARRKPFQRLNSAPTELVTDTATGGTGTYVNLAETFLADYKPTQIRAMLKMVLPAADPAERAAVEQLIGRPDDTYSRYFLYNFFIRRNAVSPATEWKAYADRVKEVNRLYKAGTTMGYETDRGKLQLKYGAPAERIPVRGESGALPYEIWVYNALPNSAFAAYFLFYQPADLTGDYRLLHSNAPDEIRNAAWRTFLFPSGSSGGVSRADQYFGSR